MYKLETHAHTMEGSACSHIRGADLCRVYKKAGYHGLFITDHFYYGNTAVPRTLPWDEWVHRFCLGYHNAREAGRKLGLDVFFGWESSYYGIDFLIYGLDETWLLAHPQVVDWSVEEQFYEIDRAGGLVVQAHPFREAPYLPRVQLYPDYVHAIEGINTGNAQAVFNRRAVAFAGSISCRSPAAVIPTINTFPAAACCFSPPSAADRILLGPCGSGAKRSS